MNDFSLNLYQLWKHQEFSGLMRNVHAELALYQVDNTQILATIIDKVDHSRPNCFVISPYANLVSYASDELHKLSTIYQYTSQALIKTVATLLAHTDIDKVQVLGNGLMATNVVSQSFINTDFAQLTHMATTKLPEHTVLIRSLNQNQHSKFIEKLEQLGWLAVANRQVYLIDDWQQVSQRRDFKRDIKLLQDNHFYFEKLTTDDHNNDEKFAIAETLYNCLYLAKYTKENVQFTASYMKQMVAANLLSLYLLFDKALNQYVGMVATIENEGVMIIPMVGYDTQLPQSKALYRRLMIFAMYQAKKGDYTLHMSAGAPQFKRHRGATPSIEYMMVYVAHLPYRARKQGTQRLIWKALSVLSVKYYAPMLRRMQL